MRKLVSFWIQKGKSLYHAIPGKPRGKAIEASARYGAIIHAPERQKLGMPADEQTPLVFAATNLHKALAFAIPKGEKLFNVSIDEANAEIVVGANRQKFMSQPLNATIFSFPDNGFVQLPHLQHQSVSTKPVPFSKTNVALKADSIEDLMRAGLQIFSFSADFKALGNDADASRLTQAKSNSEMLPVLAELVKSGKVVWENKARGLNPNAKLAEMMGISLKLAAKPSATAHRR